MRKLLVACIGVFAIAARVRAQAPVFSPEFQVNATTTGDQRNPAVASVGPASNFVVVWHDAGIVGRLFDAQGSPLSGEFPVTTSGSQFLSVNSNAGGDFVVTWGQDSVVARRFDSSGAPQGGEFLVNQFTTDYQGQPSVAISSAGDFVVVWNSGPGEYGSGPPQDGSGSGVFARRFDADGNALGDEIQVNQYTTGSQGLPRVAMNSGGDFIVVWLCTGQDAIMARRYDSSGLPQGDEFPVNTTELSVIAEQPTPDVALNPTGSAIVVWGNGDGPFSSGVYGQRLDPSGNKLGPEFNVNTYTTSEQDNVRVAATGSEFVVTWQSYGGQDGSGFGIFAQRFHANGRRKGLEFPVNTLTSGFQGSPEIAAQPNGQFLATWTSFESDGDGMGIAARLAGVPRVEITSVDIPHAGVASSPAGGSNLNGVLEVGEQVQVEPRYGNPTPDPMTLTATASNFQGPAGLTYDVPDSTADWGSIPSAGSNDCFLATGDCYQFALTGTRPAVPHVDATFDETLSYNGFTRKATIHIGESFADVPVGHAFYAFIENLVHHGVTAGCAGGGYCSGDGVTRAQMAVFLLKVRWGAEFLPAPATGTVFSDVPAGDPFAPWIEELAREGVTGGCGGTNYCPGNTVTRQQMAVFLLKALEGSAYDPPDCAGVFDDVTCTPGTGFSDWVEELANRGITGGCSVAPPLYCPANPNNRGQMAVFLVKTFGLALSGG